MDNNFLLTDEMLWDYADGLLDPAERSRVDAYLRQHPEHKTALEAIVEAKRSLSALPMEAPDAGFANRVMASWTSEQVQIKTIKPESDWIIRLISGIFGFILLSSMIVMGFAGMDSNPFKIPVDLPKTPSFDWALLLNSPVVPYVFYFGLTFLLLRILEQFLKQTGILRLKH
jgi:hypothetical protein